MANTKLDCHRCLQKTSLYPSPLFGHSEERDISLSLFMATDVSGSETEEPYVI